MLVSMLASVASLTASANGQEQGPGTPPSYSLVVARAGRSHLTLGRSLDCGDVICIDEPRATVFDHAKTLYGPTVSDHFVVMIDLDRRDMDQPLLLVIQTAPHEGNRIVRLARGFGNAMQACLDVPTDPVFSNWHPTGPGITVENGRVCASLADLAALPSASPPVQVRSLDSFKTDPLKR